MSGADAQGVKRVYVEHASEEEHQTWRDTNPIWEIAQTAVISRMLDNPGTRDAVLQLNIAAAIKDGHLETAATLAMRLSPQAWHRLVSQIQARVEPNKWNRP